MNRLCPEEEQLSEYLSGILDENGKNAVEQHLAECVSCRKLIAQAYDILQERQITKTLKTVSGVLRGTIFLILSVLFLVLSFFFNNYFLQFLVASLLSGIKHIIDSKAAKTLFLINEALKQKKTIRSNTSLQKKR